MEVVWNNLESCTGDKDYNYYNFEKVVEDADDIYGINLDNFVATLRNEDEKRGKKRKWIVEQEKEVDDYLRIHYDILPDEDKETSLFYILIKDNVLKNILLDYKNHLENIEEWNEYSPCKRPKYEHTCTKTLIPNMINKFLMDNINKNISCDDDNQEVEYVDGSYFEENLNDHYIYETQNLYSCYLMREMQRKGFVMDTALFDMRVSPGVLEKLDDSVERFRKTAIRKQMFKIAEKVELTQLNFKSYNRLLKNIFKNGEVTWERIMALFFFCADLSIRAVREKLLDIFFNIFKWTINSLTTLLASYVQNLGGWEYALAMSSTNNIILYSSCILGAGLMAYYWITRTKI